MANDQLAEEDHGDRRSVEDIVRGGEQEAKGVGSLLQKSRDVREISTANPVADFEDMVKNMNEDLVTEGRIKSTQALCDTNCDFLHSCYTDVQNDSPTRYHVFW